jgi:hypothetical protein
MSAPDRSEFGPPLPDGTPAPPLEYFANPIPTPETVEIERLRAGLVWMGDRAEEALRRVGMIEARDPLSAVEQDAALRSLGYIADLARGRFALDADIIRALATRSDRA